MKIAFVDTSIVLRLVLGEEDSYLKLKKYDAVYASELMRVEALRAIDRLRIRSSWTEKEVATYVRLFCAVSAAITFIPLQQPILRRAADSFPTLVKTLDALHLSTAILAQLQLDEQLLFLTHDKKQGLAAQACGMEAEGW